VFYAIFRIFVEIFFRAPDPQIWYIFWFLTMWEILTLPMLIVWIYYFIKLNK
jgi:prolipoprotein diacylglyceryltransferase